MYKCFAFIGCVSCVCRAYSRQRASNPLEVELEMVVNPHVDAGN